MIVIPRQLRFLLLLLGVLGIFVAGSLFSPIVARAFPFGGQASIVHKCLNNATYLMLGPPNPGPYIWTPSTKTYDFGPPKHVGQWFLGLAGAPYVCVVSTGFFTSVVWPGTFIMMVGSSQ